jgi:hypothetical protein
MLFHYFGREVLDNDVARLDEVLDDRDGLGLLHVQSDAHLVADAAVEPGVPVGLFVQVVRTQPHGVDAASGLDLDDFSSEVAEHGGQVWTGKDPAEVDDAATLKRVLLVGAQMIPPVRSVSSFSCE